MVKRIERLQTLSESESKTEVVRRALAVYEALLEHRERGGNAILRGKKVDEILIL